MKLQCIFVAITFAITLPAHATEEISPLEILIVTGTRTSQPLKQSLSHATVISEQEIQDSQVKDLPALLRSLAGIEVVQNGGLGKVSSVFMRGTESDHVLILLDGVRINSATVGTTALEHIMLDSIERIEVVRGNVSSLYGSEAIGGVIQLFTKRGSGAPAFNASGGVGSHGTKRLAAGFSGSADAISFSVNVGKVKTDGVSAINTQIAPAANPDKDGYDNTTFNAQVKQTFNADHQLSAALFSTRGDSEYDSAFNMATTDSNNAKTALKKISLTSDNQFIAMWHSKLQLARGTDDSQDYLNGVESSRFKTVNKQLTWQNELQLADTQRIHLTAEHLKQSVASDTLFSQTARSVNTLLSGYVGEYGAQQVQLNLRRDRYSDFGTANTSLLGYGLAFADHWRATASVSTAFKAPTFNDLYYPLSFGYQGNPNLQPERSRNKEVGLRYVANGQSLSAIYFDNRIRDLITIDSTFTTVINVDQARINGQELSYAGTFGDTQLKANATLQNPRNITTGKTLLKRARKYATVSASHDFGTWNAGAELRYSGEREDVGARILPSYQLVNLKAAYTINPQLNLTARVDNLFNRDYSEAYSYNTLGRTLFVGLQYLQ